MKHFIFTLMFKQQHRQSEAREEIISLKRVDALVGHKKADTPRETQEEDEEVSWQETKELWAQLFAHFIARVSFPETSSEGNFALGPSNCGKFPIIKP